MCICGFVASAQSHDDEPAAKSPAHSVQTQAIHIETGIAMPFAEPDWIDDDGHEDTDQWSSQPVGSTAMLFADPEWIDDDESHEETESWSSQPVEGTATPAAEFLGPMQGVGISVGVAFGATTLHDANGNDVTAVHRA